MMCIKKSARRSFLYVGKVAYEAKPTGVEKIATR